MVGTGLFRLYRIREVTRALPVIALFGLVAGLGSAHSLRLCHAWERCHAPLFYSTAVTLQT